VSRSSKVIAEGIAEVISEVIAEVIAEVIVLQPPGLAPAINFCLAKKESRLKV